MQTTDTLRAGAAEVDITPALDIQIAGDIGRRRPVREIRERLYAKALALECGGVSCCILSLEVCFVTHKWVDEIRRRAAEQFGLDPLSILVHSVQNHSAPAIGNAAVNDAYTGIPPDLWWLRSGDERYNEPAISGIVEAIGQAQGRLEPVTLRTGRTVDGRVAFNRRFVLRDGAAVAHPWGKDAEQVLYVEGPTDPEVGVVLLQGAAGNTVAGLLHHTCHPVHGYPHHYISSDWPGAWASAMRGTFGKEAVALVINGCCGNVHHHNHLDPNHVNNHIRMGALLAESAGRALQSAASLPATPLAWRSEKVRIPLRELPDAELAAARQYVTEHPQPPMQMEGGLPSVQWDWVYAHATLDLAATRARQPYYDYEVQAIRIGDCAMVALTGEPFVEGQLEIKLRSPFGTTWVAHMSNGYVGYVPTREALRRGGQRSFETRVSNWSKLVPEALDMVVQETLNLLQDLKRS